MKKTKNIKGINKYIANASLTIEASLVLPIFLFFFTAFLYFIQIFIVQEMLQKAITETGLSMSRAAYIYSDFYDVSDSKTFDEALLEENIQRGFKELYRTIIYKGAIKYAVESRLNLDRINNSCIVGGFDGIDFSSSQVFKCSNDIDIVARYRVRIPIRIFGIYEMYMLQRVRLRGWSGHKIPALYRVIEENNGKEESFVYVTDSGSVYHLDRTCSHISLSVEAISGKPTWQRNKNGGKYYPCEYCLKNEDSQEEIYYITSYGNRYHKDKSCPKINRRVSKIPITEVGERVPCKRCGR